MREKTILWGVKNVSRGADGVLDKYGLQKAGPKRAQSGPKADPKRTQSGPPRDEGGGERFERCFERCVVSWSLLRADGATPLRGTGLGR